MHFETIKVSVSEEPLTGTLSEVSFRNESVQDALWSIFRPNKGERLVEVRISSKGLTACFERIIDQM